MDILRYFVDSFKVFKIYNYPNLECEKPQAYGLFCTSFLDFLQLNINYDNISNFMQKLT